MRIASIIIRETNENIYGLKTMLCDKMFKGLDQIVVIFIEKQQWYAINNPQTMLESEKIMSMGEKAMRKGIIKHLNMVEKMIKSAGLKAEITKIVISGSEKYKIKRCLKLLEVDLVVFADEKKNKGIFSFFVQPLEDYIFESLKIPVLKIPVENYDIVKSAMLNNEF